LDPNVDLQRAWCPVVWREQSRRNIQAGPGGSGFNQMEWPSFTMR
jgi:hypothetical protein